eukprot:CAMPEP_0168329322 /NCGR_PEP_ID=MMETSP0213-20121227/7041_1 /TAXON_ID=151035 /ORGANISM="Euplotes harpa, Strain FSP1.4" /LENGTH=95 /DNA_ID=CAMNT_0008332629 /DNA_START=329 /DNA_END=613 /DNA_ORIENTATION=+
MKKKQEEEASRLEQMHLAMEQQNQSMMYGVTPQQYSINAVSQNSQSVLILPGAPVQPSYPTVNPFAGTATPVPVVYDPSLYGVQYEMDLHPPQAD